MPEAATAEAPAREEVNPGLRALFDIEPPADYPVTTTDEKGNDTPAAKAPVEAKPETPAPAEKPAEQPPEKTDALKLRLAPDFAAAEDKPDVPAEPPVKITDEMIENAKTPKAQADMRKFRESYEALEKEVVALRSKPAVVPPDYAEVKAMLETVTKERDDAVARVERTNLLDSPKFQKEHLQPRQKSFEKLTGIVKDAGGDPGTLQRAIAMAPGKARIEALDGIREEIGSDMLKGQFDRLVEDIDSRTADINERLRNAKQTTEELKRSETVQTHEQRQQMHKQLEGLLGAAITELTEKHGLEILKKTGKPDYQWWDDQVDEIHAVAREVFLESTPEKAAIASVMAAAYGPTRDLLKATQAALKASEQENRELKGADPTLKDGGKQPVVETVAGDADSILEGLRSGKYRK